MSRDDANSSMVGLIVAPTLHGMLINKQVDQVQKALRDLSEPEISDILIQLEPQTRAKVFRLLQKERAADIFALLPTEEQEDLLGHLREKEVAEVLNELEPDDRVELLEDVDDEMLERLMGLLQPEELEETERLLAYPDESVGREMTTRFITVESNWHISRALTHMREEGEEVERFDVIYVIDDHHKLLGYITLKTLLMNDPGTKLRVIMKPRPITLNPNDDREKAVSVMDKYDLPILPVVDDQKKLVGIVTFDDVAEVAAEEFTEDIHKMGGMEALGESYLNASIMSLIKKRGIWLIVLFLGQLGTVSVLAYFQGIINTGILAIFIPLIISSGGNSGSQTTNMIIRAIAVGELKPKDWFRVFRREIVSGLILGSLLGVLGLVRVVFGQMALIDPNTDFAFRLGFTVGTALVGVVILGSTLGSMLPFILKKLGVDPAMASGPFVATLVDVVGLIIYCTVAIMVMDFPS